MTIAKIGERICWSIASVALGWFCFVHAEMILFQSAANRRLDAEFRQGRYEAVVPEGALVGRIEIPRLKLHAVIVEGDDSIVLRRAVGHIPGTSLPGDEGNIGLAAHRDSFFRGLGKLGENDEILLTDGRGTQRYRVVRAAVVGPEDTGVLAQQDGPALTLVTCFPFRYIGAAPNRYVVTARPETLVSE